MGNQLDWSAINDVLEYKEVVDVDSVIASIICIKKFSQELSST